MSWDIFVQDLPRDAQSVDDIPDDFEPKPLGPRSIIISKIKELFPSADFSDPSWGQIEIDDWSIEVNLGTNETCEGFAFHVRGGDAAAGAVAAMLAHLNFRALDGEAEGGFFDLGSSTESLKRWRAYRDRAIGDG